MPPCPSVTRRAKYAPNMSANDTLDRVQVPLFSVSLKKTLLKKGGTFKYHILINCFKLIFVTLHITTILLVCMRINTFPKAGARRYQEKCGCVCFLPSIVLTEKGICVGIILYIIHQKYLKMKRVTVPFPKYKHIA